MTSGKPISTWYEDDRLAVRTLIVVSVELQHRLARRPLHDAAVAGADPDVVRLPAVGIGEVIVIGRLAGDRFRSGQLWRLFLLLRIEDRGGPLPEAVDDFGRRQLVRTVARPDHALMFGLADPGDAVRGLELHALEARRRTRHLAAHAIEREMKSGRHAETVDGLLVTAVAFAFLRSRSIHAMGRSNRRRRC